MSAEPAAAQSTHPLAGWLRAAAVPLTAIVLLAGLWLAAGVLAPGYDSSIAFGIAWFVLAGVGIGMIARRMPGLRLPLRATFLAVALLVGGWTAWTTFTDDVVDEQIVVGVAAGGAPAAASGNVELARADFVPLAHTASGAAAVVELPGGERKLTFAELSTDNGPDLRVYLVAGPVASDGDVKDFVDLGKLKGNKGDQQYAIPAGTDISTYGTVVIWCRAFSVSFAKAELAGV